MPRGQPQEAAVEAGAAHGTRLHELVVLLVDPLLALVVRGREGAGPRGVVRFLVDVVPRALVGEERRRYRALEVAVEEAAELARVRHRPDHSVMELPLLEDALDRRQLLRLDHCDHPLLALGDHDLPGLHPLLAERNPVEVDVDPDVARHLGE